MKEIPLTRGAVALVDDADYAVLSQVKWTLRTSRQTSFYAYRQIKHPDGPLVPGRQRRKALQMHRVIMGAPAGTEVDHIDGDGLNNQRSNLRVCSRAENGRNMRKAEDGLSRFKGVSLKYPGLWEAYICPGGRKRHIGYFHDQAEAARAYDAAAKQLYGEFARLNYED